MSFFGSLTDINQTHCRPNVKKVWISLFKQQKISRLGLVWLYYDRFPYIVKHVEFSIILNHETLNYKFWYIFWKNMPN